jgi:hypothetical protein
MPIIGASRSEARRRVVEGGWKHRRYWGLRPPRKIRRWSLVGIAVALAAVLALEAAWMWRHGLT